MSRCDACDELRTAKTEYRTGGSRHFCRSAAGGATSRAGRGLLRTSKTLMRRCPPVVSGIPGEGRGAGDIVKCCGSAAQPTPKEESLCVDDDFDGSAEGVHTCEHAEAFFGPPSPFISALTNWKQEVFHGNSVHLELVTPAGNICNNL